MISPYKKTVLRLDLFVQVTFLVLLLGSYGMTFLSFQITALEDFGFAFILPILALTFLAIWNPTMNALNVVFGNYSTETRLLRKKYMMAVGAYIGLGIIGYALYIILPYNSVFYSIFSYIGFLYIYGVSHLFAIGYAYITILENKTQKIVERRLYY
ncbi:hypothetical protein [Bernardetia sp.]|uniref:hypothetical protein n=1 Tax=Bernardetia sp. TaxID=1937974 RepID=UPI0025C4A427|nr:hypothetical protein [Bernardetia sp.]